MKQLITKTKVVLRLICLLAFLGTITANAQCPAGITWTSRTSAADNSWNSVAYGNGLFVAVAPFATGNGVMTSPDGITWTSRTPAANNHWLSVTYGNSLFVAVAASGTGNRVMTSPDGITWTSRTSAANNSWTSVTYGNGLFVAVSVDGAGNRVMTSPNGINWTSRTSAANNDWYSVTYGNGLFVAVASFFSTGTGVMTSTDGISWTSRTEAAVNQWISVTYGNGLFVAVAQTGTSNRVMTSPNGITWTIRTSAADNSWRSVTYGNGLFVAVSDTGSGSVNRVMTSPDGITWTGRTSAENNMWFSVTYGNGLFVAVGSNQVMTSSQPLVTPSVTIAANPGNSISFSTSVTFTATPTNGGTTPAYQWKKNGNNVGNNSVTYTDVALINGDIITCMLTSNDPCVSPVTATSSAITMVLAASSTITTTSALSAFASCSGTASTEQSFTVNGSNLTTNIKVTPPIGFEVSNTSGSGFTSSVKLTQSGGSVASTTVYVRLKASASGTPSGNITCVSTGATTQNIAASGTVNPLPATPTLLVLTNEAAVLPATSATAIKAVGVYVGADVALKLTATAVGATSYEWTLPAGVTLADGITTGTVTTDLNTINVKFSASTATTSLIVSVKSVNASGCSSLAKTLTLTRASSIAPANLKMNNGLNTTAITSFAKYMGTDTVLRLTAAVSATASSYVWELPEGVTRVTALDNLTAINTLETTVPEIFVTLTGVTSGNIYNYLTSATVPVSTNVLRIGVYGKNGTGLSTTVNATLANPATQSTARLLTLTAIKPAAPATLKMYDLNSLTPATAVTDIIKYVSTESELKLEAKVSALASSYTWVLSEGVNVTKNSAEAVFGSPNTYTSTSNVITVNFYNYDQNPTFRVVLGVRAVNGIGGSVSTNAAPNASRTDKLLTLTPAVPATPVIGMVTYTGKTTFERCHPSSFYADSSYGATYNWTIPPGATAVALVNGQEVNFSDTITSASNSILVYFTNITTASSYAVKCSASNVTGTSAVKSLTIRESTTCSPLLYKIAPEASVTDKFSAVAYPNPATEGFRVKSSNGKSIGVQVYDMLGRSIEQRQLQSEDQIGSNYAKGIYNVIVSQGTEVKTLRVIKQ